MRILIKAKNSYIGNSFKAWINKTDKNFVVDQISLRDMDLSLVSFKGYDVVFHVAGIAHITSNKKLIPNYFKVNRDLAVQVATKSKQDGVTQFIFTSTMAIYGNDLGIGNYRSIDIHKPNPTNAYAQSKFQADTAIQKLHNNSFKVIILRIPMVYGINSKVNFPKLEKVAFKFSFFPKIKNIRSVLHINNLSYLIHNMIIKGISGVYYPQDKTYFNTSTFIEKIRSNGKKRTIFVPHISYILKFIAIFVKSINKIYGNKFYGKENSVISGIDYQHEDFQSYIKSL